MTEFMATGHLGRKKVESAANVDRRVAATELLTAYPGLKSVYTSRVHEGRSTGSDMQFHDRPYDQPGKHKGFL